VAKKDEEGSAPGFVTHGEQEAAAAMVLHIDEELHWPVRAPDYMEIVELK